MKRIAMVLTGVVLTSCGGLGSTVDRDLLAEITIENKLLLFDAENDVSIAIDERERLGREIYDAKLKIADTEAQIDEAEEDEERADDKGDEQRAQLAAMAREVFLLKLEYLEHHLSYLRDKLDAQDGLIWVAKAKFELAKAKLIIKNNVRGSQDIEIEDYEEQVTDYVERAKETREDLAEIEQEVEAYRKQWLVTRDKLMAASGGGLGSPWAEDSAMWGDSW